MSDGCATRSVRTPSTALIAGIRVGSSQEVAVEELIEEAAVEEFPAAPAPEVVTRSRKPVRVVRSREAGRRVVPDTGAWCFTCMLSVRCRCQSSTSSETGSKEVLFGQGHASFSCSKIKRKMR